MPLYEYKKNAENRIRLPKAMSENIVCGSKEVLKSIADKIAEVGNGLVVFDGWYGVDWDSIVEYLKAELPDVRFTNSATLFKASEIIDEYRRPFLTDDPAFGWVNDQGVLENIMDEEETSLAHNNIFIMPSKA